MHNHNLRIQVKVLRDAKCQKMLISINQTSNEHSCSKQLRNTKGKQTHRIYKLTKIKEMFNTESESDTNSVLLHGKRHSNLRVTNSI